MKNLARAAVTLSAIIGMAGMAAPVASADSTTPEPSPAASMAPETTPVTSDVPETAPATSDVPETAPATSNVPETAPATSDVPETAPAASDAPETTPAASDAPAAAPQVAPQGAPATSDAPETTPATSDAPAAAPQEAPQGAPKKGDHITIYYFKGDALLAQEYGPGDQANYLTKNSKGFSQPAQNELIKTGDIKPTVVGKKNVVPVEVEGSEQDQSKGH